MTSTLLPDRKKRRKKVIHSRVHMKKSWAENQSFLSTIKSQ